MTTINTLSSIKTIVFIVFVTFSSSLFAQSEKTTEKSTIVMTRSELTSFLSTVAEARRAQLDARESRRVKQDLAELRLKYRQNSETDNSGNTDISNQEILRELRYLRQRMDNMDGNDSNFPARNRDNTTVILPGNSNSGKNAGYAPNSTGTTAIIPSNRKQIEKLQFTIDSLKNIENARRQSKDKNAYGDSLKVVSTRLTDVRRQLEILETKMKASNEKKVDLKPAANKTYFKQQVYFANNSEALEAEYYRYIQDLTQILVQYPEAKIMLEGWASPLGKPDYNKRLSMRRSEAVKKVFVNNNIDANRILTAFKGEDKTSSAQHARRVDMSVIVR
jgi:outer membrane protein OmpA-like peptidoglycan-associated protein